MILAGDIGGTNTRLALFSVDDSGRLQMTVEATFPSTKYAGLSEIVARFLEQQTPRRRGSTRPASGSPGRSRTAVAPE